MYKKIAHFVYQIKPKRKADGLVTSATFAQFVKRIFVLARDLKSSRKQSGVLLYMSEEPSISQPKITAEALIGLENSWRITNPQQEMFCLVRLSSQPMLPTSSASMEYWSFAPIRQRRISFGKKLIMKESNPTTEPEERSRAKDSRSQLS